MRALQTRLTVPSAFARTVVATHARCMQAPRAVNVFTTFFPGKTPMVRRNTRARVEVGLLSGHHFFSGGNQ
jgi:hypothetical protein